MSKEDEIRGLLEPLADDAGVVIDSLRLLQRGGAETLEVVVDLPSGTESLPLDKVADLSREFSEVLDAADPLPSAYVLEVTTPGAESELKTLRHYRRNLGRSLRVKLRDGEKLSGELVGAEEGSFTIATDQGLREILYNDVRKARPQVGFR